MLLLCVGICIRTFDWLSVVVAIAQGQLFRAGRGRKPHICRWNCHPICHGSRDISISGLNGRNACHFRLSDIVTITWGHFIRTRHGQKYLTCRRNFDAISYSSSGIA